MKKIITITILIITIIFIILYFNYDLEIESIRQLNFNNETNELTIEIIKKITYLIKSINVFCIMKITMYQ